MARSKKLLFAGIAAAVLMAGLVYFATRPSATVTAIRKALASKNYLALNELVDFPALRASVKANLARDLESRIGPASSFGAQIGITLGNMLISPMVDLAVSPAGIAFVLEGYSLTEAISSASSSAEAQARLTENISYETRWDSLSEYTVEVRKNGASVSILTLRRYGPFAWKLAGADLAVPPE